jgi:methionine biosynthesis protein MetW
MPKNSALPFEWYNTPNIHLCSIKDFTNFCDKKGIKINEFLYLNEEGEKLGHLFNNFRAYQAIFCVSKK